MGRREMPCVRAASGRSWIAPRGHRDRLLDDRIPAVSRSLPERPGAVRRGLSRCRLKPVWHGKGPKPAACPVVGGRNMAIERPAPLLRRMSRQPHHPPGPWAGGQQAKSVNQVLDGRQLRRRGPRRLALGQRLGLPMAAAVRPSQRVAAAPGPLENRAGRANAGGVVPAGFQAGAAPQGTWHRSGRGRPPTVAGVADRRNGDGDRRRPDRAATGDETCRPDPLVQGVSAPCQPHPHPLVVCWMDAVGWTKSTAQVWLNPGSTRCTDLEQPPTGEGGDPPAPGSGSA